MIAADPQVVIDEARKLLRESPKGMGKYLSISSDFVSEGDWIHLVVMPVSPGSSALDFVDEIERIERELRAKFGEEILIVPAKP